MTAATRPLRLGAFRDWAEHHNLPAVRAVATVKAWLSTGVFGIALVLLAGEAPGVREFFGLQTGRALVVLAVVCVVSTVGLTLIREASHAVRGVGALFGNALTIWFAASLVALSSARGAAVFALLPVFVATYHGHLFRTGTRYPFGVLPTCAGMLGALALDARHAGLFGLIVPLAVGLNVTLGTFALRTHELSREGERLREAVAAQAVRVRSLEIQKLSMALLDVLGQNHDISNTLAAARLNIDWLHRETAEGATPPDNGELHTLATETKGSLERLARILEESKRIGKEMGPDSALHDVDVVAIVERLRATIDRRFHVPVRFDHGDRAAAHVLVRGGTTMLERILENVLVNACEGNGVDTASEVTIAVTEEPGFLVIAITDDGPGFTAAALTSDLVAFTTTKVDGSGLGLYTAQRLIAASGGELTRANRPEGGALVRVVLAKGRAA